MKLPATLQLPLKVVSDLRELRLVLAAICLVMLIFLSFVYMDQHGVRLESEKLSALFAGLTYHLHINGSHSDLVFSYQGIVVSFNTIVIFAALVWLLALAVKAQTPMAVRITDKAVTLTPLSVFGFPAGKSLVRELGEFTSIGLTSEQYRGGYCYSLVLWGKEAKPNIIINEWLVGGNDDKTLSEIKDQARQLGVLLHLPLVTPETEGLYDAGN